MQNDRKYYETIRTRPLKRRHSRYHLSYLYQLRALRGTLANTMEALGHHRRRVSHQQHAEAHYNYNCSRDDCSSLVCACDCDSADPANVLCD